MHDLIADIKSQRETLLANASLLDQAYDSSSRWTGGSDGFVITGMATSLWAWHSASLILSGAAIGHAVADTSEYHRYGTAQSDTSPLIITSRSGESAEIINLLDVVQPGRPVIAVTASEHSTLGRKATHILPFKAEEKAFYNTSSFTTTLCVATSMAAGLANRTDLAPADWLTKLAENVDVVANLDQEVFAAAGGVIARSRVALMTARGHLIGVAKQASLDLQEGMRIAAIPVSGGLLRHGPMELINLPDSAVVMLIPNDHMAGIMARLASDLIGYGGSVVAIAADGVSLPATVNVIRVPEATPELNAVIFAVALQKLNVSIAQALNMSSIDPVLIPKITRVE
ncbi:SIS domain-containing protein [Agrobacterium rosae]|uniref:SIS domain-containing protein n=1 Tax=Agrobacterium rosae TaxID=1972867 RepID=UPI002033A6E9|nr:SIS domain-containing protein [Agrobacterium rosae]MCM2435803.1 SIS domain-containing protein [Agrobacterium rosae]